MKNKAFPLVNITGLSIGISAALVIFLIVQYDLGFDKFEKNGDRIYRVVEDYVMTVSGEKSHGAGVPDPLGNAVNKEVTGLETASAFYRGNAQKISIPAKGGNKAAEFASEDKIVFADPHYFNLISYNWLAGNTATALQQPYQVVLTESKAKLYFPSLSVADVVGKQLDFDDTIHAVVTGVVKDITQNTDFDYKIFFSRITLDATNLKPRFWDRWNHSQGASQLYVKLSAGVTPANIKAQLAALYKKYSPVDPNEPAVRSFSLQPLSDVHFKTAYDSYSPQLADRSVLYSLLAVAAFLLLLACINFINLTTAQATQRAKEIGIRKTMGSTKGQLVSQFLGETFWLTLLATIVSVALTPALLKAFSAFIPQGVTFNVFRQPAILLFLISLVIVVTLLAGFYPAVILSSFKPIAVLKTQSVKSTGNGAWFRKGLTVFQFVVAQVFIISTILVSKQIKYTLNKNIGFKKEAVIYAANYTDTSAVKKQVLLSRFKAIPGVAAASLSMDPPSSNSTWMVTLTANNGKRQFKTDAQVKIGDTNYINLYNIKLLWGVNLPYSDTMQSLLINETCARMLGFTNPQQAVGKYIDCYGQKPIVGVIHDFNQKSLHETVGPLLIASETPTERTFNIALKPQNAEGTLWPATISEVEKAWKAVYPKTNFDYAFLDASIAAYYTNEKNISTLLLWSTGLTIFISCLGLFGLALYVTNQRTKEIGVRKIIGASVAQLITLLSKDFLKLIVIAFIIAVPFAWWGSHAWLQSFAYRTSLSWWVFGMGGALMLLLAFAILSIRTFKAAAANPVKSLRSE